MVANKVKKKFHIGYGRVDQHAPKKKNPNRQKLTRLHAVYDKMYYAICKKGHLKKENEKKKGRNLRPKS